MDELLNIKKPDISVILPVYNVEKQLLKCLKSISEQKFSGIFEIIAAEACSTDNSLAILKSFQANEPRLKIIEHPVREQLSTSRIEGVAKSTGKYILHVDSDDWLLPNALETLFKACEETNADVVVFDYVKEDSEGRRTPGNSVKRKLITTDKLKVQHYFYGACWNKIAKRVINENMVYSEIGATNTEDLIYSTEILLKAETICVIPIPLYVYYVNTASSSYTTNWEQYAKNQMIVLTQLEKIFYKYKAGSVFTNNVLNYFEKWIYLGIAKTHFWKKEELANTAIIIKGILKFSIMSKHRVNRLDLATKNKYVSLIEVAKHFNIKMVLSVLLRSFC